jgi:hypothetical protein
MNYQALNLLRVYLLDLETCVGQDSHCTKFYITYVYIHKKPTHKSELAAAE